MKTLTIEQKLINTFNRRNLETATAVHDEANGYCFKCTNGKFIKFGFKIVNELSHLEIVNRSLL